MPATPRIFVSHSHQDNAFGLHLVQDLHRALRDDNATCWYDAAGGLHGGDAWWSTIREEIRARDIFLVLLSPAAVTSHWVNDEVDIAWKLRRDLHKTIIPLLIQPCQMREDLATLPAVSFLAPRPYTEALAELLQRLGIPPALASARPTPSSETGKQPTGERSVAPLPAPTPAMLQAPLVAPVLSRWQRFAVVGSIAVVMLLILAGILYAHGRGNPSTTVATNPKPWPTSTPAPTATPTAVASDAYQVVAPGPCDPNTTLWQSDSTAVSTCTSQGLAIASSTLANLPFNHPFAQSYTVSIVVSNLTNTTPIKALAGFHITFSDPTNPAFQPPEILFLMQQDGTCAIEQGSNNQAQTFPVPSASAYTLKYTFDGTTSHFFINTRHLLDLANSAKYQTNLLALYSMVQDTSYQNQFVTSHKTPYQAQFATFSYQP